MEFNEKLQELRKLRGLTQEELATALYVTRTAISKWESGRGYPNIDSLRRISAYFNVTVDDLLSSQQLLTIAEEERKEKGKQICSLIFGLLDISVAMFLFLPLFGQALDGKVANVPLIFLANISSYTRLAYFTIVVVSILIGIIALALQNYQNIIWQRSKQTISLIWNIIGALLFIVSPQPYVASFLFIYLIFKFIILIKTK